MLNAEARASIALDGDTHWFCNRGCGVVDCPDATHYTTPEPTVDELEMGNLQAQFDALEVEWNTLDRATDLNALALVAADTVVTPEMARQGVVARELRAVGERMMVLKRKMIPDLLPGYNLNGGAR